MEAGLEKAYHVQTQIISGAKVPGNRAVRVDQDGLARPHLDQIGGVPEAVVNERQDSQGEDLPPLSRSTAEGYAPILKMSSDLLRG